MRIGKAVAIGTSTSCAQGELSRARGVAQIFQSLGLLALRIQPPLCQLQPQPVSRLQPAKLRRPLGAAAALGSSNDLRDVELLQLAVEAHGIDGFAEYGFIGRVQLQQFEGLPAKVGR